MPLAEIARQVGVTKRTLQRHRADEGIDAMLENLTTRPRRPGVKPNPAAALTARVEMYEAALVMRDVDYDRMKQDLESMKEQLKAEREKNRSLEAGNSRLANEHRKASELRDRFPVIDGGRSA